MKKLRSWKLLLPLAALAAVARSGVGRVRRTQAASEIRVAIMTDCKGAFALRLRARHRRRAGRVRSVRRRQGQEQEEAVGRDDRHQGRRHSNVQIVGYGCGDDTVPTAVKETRRLMEQLKADVMIGPLSGDEAVSVANYAKSHPTKTFIIGTAGSQDPTLQIAPKNVFRYHGDGAQWNAGIGEIVYKKLGWRKAAIIMDDYSFGWTSAAGIIADFCAIGGKITKRVFPPLNTTDYAPFVRQLPRPGTVDGYFWVVGGTGTGVQPEGVRAGLRRDRPEAARREPVLRVPRRRQGRRPEGRRHVRRRVRHRPRPQDAAGEGLRGGHEEVVPEAAGSRRLRLQLLQRRLGAGPRL